jgi:hypothetical protein
MPEYNKYGVKYGKKHIVVKATTKPDDGVHLDGRDYKFNGSQFYLNDAGAAKEIDQEFGAGKGGTGDVVVVEKEFREPGHTYRFVVPELPWKKAKNDIPC